MQKKFKSQLIHSLLLCSLLLAPVATVANTTVAQAAVDNEAKTEQTLRAAQQFAAFSKEDQANIKAQLQNQGIDTAKLSDAQLAGQTVKVMVQLPGATGNAKAGRQVFSKTSMADMNKASTKVINGQGAVAKAAQKITGNKVAARFGYLLNGFTINAKVSQISQLKKISGVKTVVPTTVYKPMDKWGNAVGGVDQVWQDQKLKGTGTAVAVIDTGIDPTHKDLRLSDPSKVKLSKTKAESLITQLGHGKWYSDKVPYAYNYSDGTANTVIDTGYGEMHGMHVAGIIGANGLPTKDETKSVVGVAPEAQILAMKVFSNTAGHGITDEQTIQAIEDADKLGADVINMSLGSSVGFDSDNETEALAKAAKDGVIPVVSASNDGLSTSDDATNVVNKETTADSGTVGSPSTGSSVISVASAHNSHQVNAVLSATGDGQAVFAKPQMYQLADGTDISSLNGKQLYIAKNGKDGLPGIGNPDDFDKSVAGKIAVVARGSIAFTAKQANAKAAGAAGVIIIDNKDEETLAFSLDKSIPTFALSLAGGKELLSFAEKKPAAKYVFTAGNQVVADSDYGDLSNFTSWGPTPTLSFKPDITAPGGMVWSLANDNKYQSMQGTSMASPFIAGVSALMAESLRGRVPKAELSTYVKTALMNTSKVMMDTTHKDTVVSPRRQGAGLVQAEKAISDQVFATGNEGQPSVALRQIKSSNTSFTIQLDNVSSKAAQYKFNDYGGVYADGKAMDEASYDVKQAGAGIQVASATDAQGQSVLTSDGQIAVAPGAKVTVTFALSLPASATNNYVEGFVGFQSADSQDGTAADLVVPYMGYYGDWTDQKVFDDPIYDDSSVYGTSYFSDADKNILGLSADGKTIWQDTVAISPNDDDSQDTATPTFSLFRNVENAEINIYDQDPTNNPGAKPIRTLYKDPQVLKTYYDTTAGAYTNYSTAGLTWDGTVWDSQKGKQVTAPDGQYYYQISGVPVGADESARQSQTLKLKVDTKAPTISLSNQALSHDGNGKYFLTVGADDFGGSGLANGNTIAITINGHSHAYQLPALSGPQSGETVNVPITDDQQLAAIQDGRNEVTASMSDNAGNIGTASVTTDNTQFNQENLSLYNLSYGQTISSTTENYDAKTKTISVTGAYTGAQFYINGTAVKPDEKQQFTAKGIAVPTNGVFVFSRDADGQDVIKTVRTRVATTAPAVTLSGITGNAAQSTTGSFKIAGTAQPADNIASVVATNTTTKAKTDLTGSLAAGANNTASFSGDVALQYGANTISLAVTDKDGNTTTKTITVQSKDDSQFVGDHTKILNMSNDIGLDSLNVAIKGDKHYDADKHTYTIEGTLRRPIDKNGLKIGEVNGQQTTIQWDPKTLAFKATVPVKDNAFNSIPIQVFYQGKAIFSGSVQLIVDTTLPTLNFGNHGMTVDKDGVYHVKADANPFVLTGEATDNHDGAMLTINGSVIANQTLTFNYHDGNNGQPIKFSVPLYLQSGDNYIQVTMNDGVGNQVQRTIDVEY